MLVLASGPKVRIHKGENMSLNTTVLELKEIKKTYIKNSFFHKQKTEVLKGANLTVEKGQTLALIGPSGCGKTTLLKIILGLEKQNSGAVILFGNNTSKTSKKELRKILSKIGVIFQDPYSALDPRQTIEQILSEPFIINKIPYTRQILVKALKEVSLNEHDLKKYPHQFSGGQRQRINIARALILKPQLIIADEPTSALDVSVQAQIINLLTKMQKKYNFALLFVSHNLALCKYLCQNIVLVKQGILTEISGDEL